MKGPWKAAHISKTPHADPKRYQLLFDDTSVKLSPH